MSTTLTTTYANSEANSYVSLAEAEVIVTTLSYLTFLGLDVSGWSGASDEAKKVALVMAAKRIDAQRFIGYKYLNNQALQWPRVRTGKRPFNHETSDTAAPETVQQAQVADAVSMLNAADKHPTEEGIASESIDGHNVVYDRKHLSTIRDNISSAAVELLKTAGLIQTGFGHVHLPRG